MKLRFVERVLILPYQPAQRFFVSEKLIERNYVMEIREGLTVLIPIRRNVTFVNPETGETEVRTVASEIEATVVKVEKNGTVVYRFSTGTTGKFKLA